MVMKRRDFNRFFTFSGRNHYLWKVLLDRNGRAVLSGIILYFFGPERHNFTKKDTPGVSFSAVFSNSLNMKRRRVLPLSDSLKPDDIGFCQTDVPQAYAIPIKLVKNNWGTRQKWRGKKGTIITVVSAICHSWTWHFSAFVSRVGISHSYFSFASMDLGTLFGLLSTHCLVIMTFDTLISNTANSINVPPICSREVDLCKETTSLW